MSTQVRVERIVTKRQRRAFVRFPWRVYRGDPNWVPPLLSERLSRLRPDKNPFLQQARLALWAAYRGRAMVGTIAAFVDPRANAHLGTKMGGFGFFEVLEDYEAAARLLDVACEQVQDWGMDSLRGPTNLGAFEEPGVLVDGADCPPALLEAHTPPYYRAFLERYGMEQLEDIHAWRVHLPDLGPNLEGLPLQVLRVFEAARQRRGITIRKMRLGDWDREVATLHRLFSVTLEHLPYHVPITLEEFQRLAQQMRPFIDADMAMFAEVAGQEVGFLVAIPDMNRVLIHLNGRLFPLGWLRAWWHSRRIDVISFKLLGVLEQYRRWGIDVLLYLEALKAAVARGYTWLDGSVTSEFNPTVVRLANRFGAERYKHYRTYQILFNGAAAES